MGIGTMRVVMDCDKCAVERLRFQKDYLEKKTFMDHVRSGRG
jgi:hypothetical protein